MPDVRAAAGEASGAARGAGPLGPTQTSTGTSASSIRSTRASSSASADDRALAVELEHQRHRRPRPRPRSICLVDEVDEHSVEQAADLDHRDDPRVGSPASWRAGGRRPTGGRASTGASSERQGHRSAIARVRLRRRDAGTDGDNPARGGLIVDPAQFFAASRLVIVAGKGGVGKTVVTRHARPRRGPHRAVDAWSSRSRARAGCPPCSAKRPLAYDEVTLVGRRRTRRRGRRPGPHAHPRRRPARLPPATTACSASPSAW